MLKCFYCGKDVKNERSKKQHEIRCLKNDNRIIVKPSYGMLGKKGANQYTYGAKLSLETKKKIGEAFKNKPWTEERKLLHSEHMKRAVANNPESYSSGNRGRVKRIEYDGISFQGKWELYFYQWCKRNNVSIQKCNEWFEYEWNGTRKYFPDFKLPEQDTYVEVKGYKTDRDETKWSQFKKKLLVVEKKDIPHLLNDTYVLGL